MSRRIPSIDKRLAVVCQRIRDLATKIEQHYHHGLVHHFVEEHVIEAHGGWRVEILTRELEDYLNSSEESQEVPLSISTEESIHLLRQVLEGCTGVRGIESPCAPNSNLLKEIDYLLLRAPEAK